jgi:hypothetical protein
MRVTAPDGVTWTRRTGAVSTGSELLRALTEIDDIYTDMSRQWNWWQEGRLERERDRLLRVLNEWDNGALDVGEEERGGRTDVRAEQLVREAEAVRRWRAGLVARLYDRDREFLRLRLLRAETDSAFLAHVLKAPASPTQRRVAERLVADREATATALRRRLVDPEQVVDPHGFFPAERRVTNLRSHMDHWRHPTLRTLVKTDKRRLEILLGMPMPDPSAMCSECQAPTEWHKHGICLRLFHTRLVSGAQVAASVLVDQLDQCPACVAYDAEHGWDGHAAKLPATSFALPEFDYQQWHSLLPPLLLAIVTRPRTDSSTRKIGLPQRDHVSYCANLMAIVR